MTETLYTIKDGSFYYNINREDWFKSVQLVELAQRKCPKLNK